MSIGKALTVLVVLGLSGVVQAEDRPVVAVQRLTLESVQSVLSAAIEECRKQGTQVTVTVVDKNGTVQGVARDTLAPPVSLGISREKAYTAANFSVATSELGDLAKSPIGAVDNVTMSAGGIVIEAGGVIYGGVGVSGAPSGQIDEDCARAGLAAISDDLEMME
ncbi:MAG TPA: adenosylcobalamin biosynthesis, GlcG-related protein [Gammaproteobacteria bacterium]|nr:adenosylcobalamin biosynthesis, GlcG-related protein [Gammaproteobacteria bacterium]